MIINEGEKVIHWKSSYLKIYIFISTFLLQIICRGLVRIIYLFDGSDTFKMVDMLMSVKVKYNIL